LKSEIETQEAGRGPTPAATFWELARWKKTAQGAIFRKSINVLAFLRGFCY
jgi:hypothetical protein